MCASNLTHMLVRKVKENVVQGDGEGKGHS